MFHAKDVYKFRTYLMLNNFRFSKIAPFMR